MRKFIIACAGAALLVSISACSSLNGTNSSASPQTTNAQSTVAFPENSGNATFQPNAAPNVPGAPGNQSIPPPAGTTPNGY